MKSRLTTIVMLTLVPLGSCTNQSDGEELTYTRRAPIGVVLPTDSEPDESLDGYGVVLLTPNAGKNRNLLFCDSFKNFLTPVRVGDTEEAAVPSTVEGIWQKKRPIYWLDQRVSQISPHRVEDCDVMLQCYDFHRSLSIISTLGDTTKLDVSASGPVLAAWRKEVDDYGYFVWDVSDLPAQELPDAVRQWWHIMRDPNTWDEGVELVSVRDRIALYLNNRGYVFAGALSWALGEGTIPAAEAAVLDRYTCRATNLISSNFP